MFLPSQKIKTSCQNFWYLTTSSTASAGAATKTAFGVDMDGDGVIEASNADGLSEFGEWSVDAASGTPQGGKQPVNMKRRHYRVLPSMSG
jgi:hypothetical protein